VHVDLDTDPAYLCARGLWNLPLDTGQSPMLFANIDIQSTSEPKFGLLLSATLSRTLMSYLSAWLVEDDVTFWKLF
jgi:hypothetical protein